MKDLISSNLVHTGDLSTQAIQAAADQTRRAVNARGTTPVVTAPVAFTAGEVKVINHGLGRQPSEWSVADVITGYGAFRRTAWDAKTITIQSANACTARFKVT